jgi:hypothetical protein
MIMKKEEIALRTVMATAVAWCPVFFILFFLAGCRPSKEFASDSRLERFAGLDETITDSIFIYLSDSVFIREKNDTVFVDRYHTLYKYRLRTDTLTRRDSVYIDRDVRVMETVEVNRLTGWQNFQVWLGRILAGTAVLFVIYKRIKRRLSE